MQFLTLRVNSTCKEYKIYIKKHLMGLTAG